MTISLLLPKTRINREQSTPLPPPAGDKDSVRQVQVKALEAEIDWPVYNLYGLTEEEIAMVEGGIK